MFRIDDASLQKFGIKTKTLYTDPQISLFSDVLSNEECQHIMNVGEKYLERSLVANRDGKLMTHESRTSRNCWLNKHGDSVVEKVSGRISKILSLNLENAGKLQLVHYRQGERFKEHFDTLDDEENKDHYGVQSKGQRQTTALIYLNNVAAGGHTAFPELSIKVRPKAGFMLAFQNCLPDMVTTHPQSLHGSLPVDQGEKWVCNLWFREKPKASAAQKKESPTQNKHS